MLITEKELRSNIRKTILKEFQNLNHNDLNILLTEASKSTPENSSSLTKYKKSIAAALLSTFFATYPALKNKDETVDNIKSVINQVLQKTNITDAPETFKLSEDLHESEWKILGEFLDDYTKGAELDTCHLDSKDSEFRIHLYNIFNRHTPDGFITSSGHLTDQKGDIIDEESFNEWTNFIKIIDKFEKSHPIDSKGYMRISNVEFNKLNYDGNQFDGMKKQEIEMQLAGMYAVLIDEIKDILHEIPKLKEYLNSNDKTKFKAAHEEVHRLIRKLEGGKFNYHGDDTRDYSKELKKKKEIKNPKKKEDDKKSPKKAKASLHPNGEDKYTPFWEQ